MAALLDAPDSEDELIEAPVATGGGSDSEEEAALRYEAMVDEYLDRSYQTYLERQHAREANKVERQKRKRLADAGACLLCSLSSLSVL